MLCNKFILCGNDGGFILGWVTVIKNYAETVIEKKQAGSDNKLSHDVLSSQGKKLLNH